MFSLSNKSAEVANAGLCATCQHCRRMESDRGSVFILCQLSFKDPQFAKYPRLPVLRCAGYQPKENPVPTSEP